jgi:pyruvate dehydrogenase E2 component (dihydrolipoamide acetyltransferase)
MARESGLDLAQVHGSGPGGRIMERDVHAAQKDKPTAAAQPAPSPVLPPQAAPQPQPPQAQTTPLSKMRQAIARRMAESKTTVPHFYVTVEIDMTEALKLREQVNALVDENAKVSVNDLVVTAVARTLTQFPILNASYKQGFLEQHPDINIGFAVAVEEGLLTPVLHNVDQKSLKIIAAETRAITERARTNKMKAEDLGGGTFTVSNLGRFGVDEFSAIINPPEAAILAVGAAIRKPVVTDNDTVHIASLMKATLSVDHRVADGAQAARFMQALKMMLESPLHLLWD